MYVRQRRRVITVAIVLLSLAFLMPWARVWADTSSSATMAVTCNVAPVIEAEFPQDFAMPDISPGPTPYESPPLPIRIRSNCIWVIKMKSDRTDGRMKEWNGSSYVETGSALSSPLEWKVDGFGSYAPLTSTEVVIANGVPTEGGNFLELNIRLRQAVSPEDQRLEAGSAYRAVITFTAAVAY